MTIGEVKAVYAPDQKAQEAIWVHGCDAKQVGLIKDIIKSGKRSEICVSKISDTDHFQLYGILVKGHVTLMSKVDLGSKYDPVSGERTFSLPFDLDRLNNVLVAKYDDLKNDYNQYTESFIIPTEIVGVWEFDYFLNRADDIDMDDLNDLLDALALIKKRGGSS